MPEDFLVFISSVEKRPFSKNFQTNKKDVFQKHKFDCWYFFNDAWELRPILLKFFPMWQKMISGSLI